MRRQHHSTTVSSEVLFFFFAARAAARASLPVLSARGAIGTPYTFFSAFFSLYDICHRAADHQRDNSYHDKISKSHSFLLSVYYLLSSGFFRLEFFVLSDYKHGEYRGEHANYRPS